MSARHQPTNPTTNTEGPTVTMHNDTSGFWHLKGVDIPFERWEQARDYRDARPELAGLIIQPKVYNWSNAR